MHGGAKNTLKPTQLLKVFAQKAYKLNDRNDFHKFVKFPNENIFFGINSVKVKMDGKNLTKF